MHNTSADPIADTLDLLPAGTTDRHTVESAHQVRPFGLTLAVPTPDAVDLTPISYDPQRQIATVGDTPVIDTPMLPDMTVTQYQTTVDHQRMTDKRFDRPTPKN
ncbi:MAG TPA: hypothetical protein VFX70_22615 [Mycobacteriales bacterium]|nr:hypothetical protein [Mycobacteriales bacterium]